MHSYNFTHSNDCCGHVGRTYLRTVIVKTNEMKEEIKEKKM